MKVKEITNDYILFDNNKKLIYKIKNQLKYDLYEYYFDFFSFISIGETISENIQLERLPYVNNGKSIGSFNSINSLIYPQKIPYSYDYKTSEFSNHYDEQEYYEHDSIMYRHYDLRNIGIVFVEYEKIKQKNTYKNSAIKKTRFLPVYKKKSNLTNEEMNELHLQIQEIEKHSNKYSNTYTLEEKISAQIQIDILYDNKIISTFNGIDFIELPGSYIHSDDELKYDESTSFKIKEIYKDHIEFTNGKRLDCDKEYFIDNEQAFANFMQIDESAIDMIFYENELVFKQVPRKGFCFGNRNGNMIFVPCMKENGKDGGHADIYYDLKLVLHL